ncbi:hypothetical protein [Paraburkholderia terrae]|jgi:hypothetical protein|uniref:Uncharacterized protein n=1 Tax=Paraburkholderia terrae TaxID=311230 RepID=A0A2I8ERS7_9BURK|nr:hypothetical protein [Paraburkholderia terrae]AUT62297.1 hypothetical protein C2L65_21940 [Paraburkholderia terrae]
MEMRVHHPAVHPMPEIAAFVADLKSAFGEWEIDEAIRRGKAGEPTFYACENGRSVGTPRLAVTDAFAHDPAYAPASEARQEVPGKESER